MRVCVFVLGEVGRSPRMQYHSLSLAKFSKVDLVGLDGSKPHPQILQNPNIQTHFISDTSWKWMPRSNKLLFMLFAPLKVILQSLLILWTLLFSISKPDYLLVQNPPAIPTLFIVQFVCFVRGIKLIIDWHNFGYTILQLSVGEKSLLVKIAKWIEMSVFGSRAFHHFCVSKHMKEELKNKWGINATVLYDRPPKIFKDLTLREKHNLFAKLTETTTEGKIEKTMFTILDKQKDEVTLRSDRPGLLVSSTSWTKDEDFSILLDAIVMCDEKARNSPRFPKLQFIITGKGPEKEMYLKKIAKLNLKFCNIQTKWLESEDYPKLLACSDLGICLHYSSSGVDLPMKVVDMFGAGLPVCAINFKALPELVEHGFNGIIFNDRKELAKHIFDLFENFPQQTRELDKMRQNLKKFRQHRWDNEWDEKAKPIFIGGK